MLASASETSQAVEVRVRHCDGRLLQTECRITNLLGNAAVAGIVVNLRDITERKRFEEQLTFQAFHDSVTNLPNRALFHDRVGHALSRRRTNGQPIVDDNLWALETRTGGSNVNLDALYFAAGINNGADGLFGEIVLTPEPATIFETTAALLLMVLFRIRRRGRLS